MKLIDISEVAKRSGLPAATLRFYEEKGLIESLGRRGLRRTFDPGVLGRLSLIALGRMAGFSLDEIAAMLGSRQRPEIDRALLSAKSEELGRTIRQLGALKNGLEHAATCPAPTHIECPSFQRLMKVAAARMGRSRRLPSPPPRAAAP
ncbi:MAG: helix-turn-helix domain-containing protein [Pseudomonadota bacterium]